MDTVSLPCQRIDLAAGRNPGLVQKASASSEDPTTVPSSGRRTSRRTRPYPSGGSLKMARARCRRFGDAFGSEIQRYSRPLSSACCRQPSNTVGSQPRATASRLTRPCTASSSICALSCGVRKVKSLGTDKCPNLEPPLTGSICTRPRTSARLGSWRMNNRNSLTRLTSPSVASASL
jgi:hypothetical protein